MSSWSVTVIIFLRVTGKQYNMHSHTWKYVRLGVADAVTQLFAAGTKVYAGDSILMSLELFLQGGVLLGGTCPTGQWRFRPMVSRHNELSQHIRSLMTTGH